jgi:urea transport system ATP-binding protein
MSARPENAIHVEGLVVSFGNFKAIDNLSFVADYGHVRAVIGPNGAGKTTLLDVLTGRSRARSGRVLLDGVLDLTRRNEVELALAGIGRKFQKPSVFEALTVGENLDLARRRHRRSLLREVLSSADAPNTKVIDEVLERIGLVALRDARAGILSHGQKQWLEIGMVLVQEPKVLLLDEPVAGMSDEETAQTAILVRSLRSPERSIIVVEHDMDFVEQIADQVTVLHEGRTLFEGSMQDARTDSGVLDVYLGR